MKTNSSDTCTCPRPLGSRSPEEGVVAVAWQLQQHTGKPLRQRSPAELSVTPYLRAEGPWPGRRAVSGAWSLAHRHTCLAGHTPPSHPVPVSRRQELRRTRLYRLHCSTAVLRRDARGPGQHEGSGLLGGPGGPCTAFTLKAGSSVSAESARHPAAGT